MKIGFRYRNLQVKWKIVHIKHKACSWTCKRVYQFSAFVV